MYLVHSKNAKALKKEVLLKLFGITPVYLRAGNAKNEVSTSEKAEFY
jgi:hypothetical protein